MFQAVKFPTRVSNLDTCLANVDTKTLSHVDDLLRNSTKLLIADEGGDSACNVQILTGD